MISNYGKIEVNKSFSGTKACCLTKTSNPCLMCVIKTQDDQLITAFFNQ